MNAKVFKRDMSTVECKLHITVLPLRTFI